jgi:hypothetical protein
MPWPAVFLALDLSTSTPDALCPPLDEARAAVSARVGEVRGDYHADFARVRGEDGQQTLELTLREGNVVVLRRELPLDAAGCQDAAQAIALVLERYFDAIERPAEPPTTPELETVPASPPAPPVEAPRRDQPPPLAEQTPKLKFSVQLGLLVDRELGLASALGFVAHPGSWRIGSRFRWGVGLHLAPFLSETVQTVRGQRVAEISLQGALSLPVTWSHAGWQATLAPWAQLRFQRAQAPSLEHEQAAFRTVPGLGGAAWLGFAPTRGFLLLGGLAAGGQLKTAASRFVLAGETGRNAVLVPDAWFGQGQLALSLEL